MDKKELKSVVKSFSISFVIGMMIGIAGSIINK